MFHGGGGGVDDVRPKPTSGGSLHISKTGGGGEQVGFGPRIPPGHTPIGSP